jgi:transcriptional regulator with XRE-family HTH domain
MPKSVFSESYSRFREMLVQARKDAALTQAELAARLGRPQSFVSKYEHGERRLDVIEFLEVTEALGINAVSFVRKLQAMNEGGKDAD